MRHLNWTVVLVLSAAAAGCKPDLGAPESVVTGPRILAVRGTPPEVPESGAVSYDLLAVDVTGTVPSPDVGWAQCTSPTPPADANDVSGACLSTPDDAGPSPTFMGTIPANDCMVFGPETPPPVKGMPPIRAADADTTGGYYQPVRATWLSTEDVAFALQRIRCPLVTAPGSEAAQYAATYVPNNNPHPADLVLDPAGIATSLYAPGQPPVTSVGAVAAGQRVTLQADFDGQAAETFLLWDVVQLMLVTQRESLRVSWYATAGSFVRDVSGRASDDPETYTQNEWTAPTTPGAVYLWAVLRDNRGGIDFASAEIDVRP